MKEKAYYEDVNIKNELKLRELLENLPPYCKQFFIGIEPETASRTRLAYAYDLGCFFDYLHQNNTVLAKSPIREISLSSLEALTAQDIEEYLFYLKFYEKDGVVHTNDEKGIKRKLASLRTFYNYLYKREFIDSNPVQRVDMPKIHEKTIVRLDTDEVEQLLDEVDSGENLSKNQLRFHEKTKVRDLALLTLLLGTGIRVSECVGLNLKDLDFKNNGIKIHRKGGAEVIVYFGDEVKDALLNYLEERKCTAPAEGHEEALFLSLQKKRIGVRSVENLVSKYAALVTSVKHITPHKLRSTYGTNLYRETGDIYLVADVLGHKDVNTTRRHYAAIEDDRRKKAAEYITLRKDATSKNDAISRSEAISKNDSVPSSTGTTSKQDTAPSSTDTTSKQDTAPSSTGTTSKQDTEPSSTDTTSEQDSVPSSTDTTSEQDSVPSSTDTTSKQDTAPFSTDTVSSNDDIFQADAT